MRLENAQIARYGAAPRQQNPLDGAAVSGGSGARRIRGLMAECDVGQMASRRSGRLDSRARAVPVLPLPSCGYWEEQRSEVMATAWGPLSPSTPEQALCRLVSALRARI